MGRVYGIEIAVREKLKLDVLAAVAVSGEFLAAA